MSQIWKTIALFISSTFRDMHAECDQLNRVVFPAIEERLKPRRCRIAPIDLRVGVETDSTQTERQSEPQILKVCLAEIELSHPFLPVLLATATAHGRSLQPFVSGGGRNYHPGSR
jgi:hypothetical protein